MSDPTGLPTANLWRRLAGMIYDALLLAALLMVVTGMFLPLTGGEALIDASRPIQFIHRMVLVAVWIAFYGIFWMRTGQTLGMAAWRLKLIRADGQPLQWSDVLRRLGAGVLSALPAGAGFLWSLVDRNRLTWHDRISRTHPVVVPRKAK
jgi:uncharacterized RDD family membrane protein YckC